MSSLLRLAAHRWHSVLLLLAALAAPAGVLAATAEQAPADSRVALGSRQAQLDAAHALARAACMRKFLVNRCLDREDGAYRAASADLRLRLAVVDRRERARRAATLRASIASAAAAAAPPLSPHAARSHRARRQRQLDEKQRDHREKAAQASARRQAFEARQRGRTHAAPPLASSEARAAYLAKQAEYAQRREQARIRQAQRPDAAPLPLPGARR